MALWSPNDKCKWTNVISLILEALNKNDKVFVVVMECINAMQLDIDKRRNKVQKNQLQYLKLKNKKIHC